MMTTSKRRLKKIETSLTPKEVVLLRLKNEIAWADGLPTGGGLPTDADLPAYADRYLGDGKPPRNKLAEQIEEVIRQAMRSEKAHQVDQAVRQAVREGDFLFGLCRHVNTNILDEFRTNVLQTGLLAEQIQGILERDSFSNEMSYLLHLVSGPGVAYPVEASTADAVEAAIRNEVIVWDLVEPTDWRYTFHDDDICMHFVNQGKTQIPWELRRLQQRYQDDEDDRPDVWKLEERPGDEELLNLFGDVEAFRAYMAGDNYSFGLADVTDEEAMGVRLGVFNELKALTDKGEIKAGSVVCIPSVPVPFLQDVPLIDGEWIDRYVVELAEWAALLTQEGFQGIDIDDQHRLNHYAFYPPGVDLNEKVRQEETDFADLSAIHDQARKNLKKFRGKTKKIEGREYLHLDAYRKWKGRLVEDDLNVQNGYLIQSFNAWYDAQGGWDKARLAGVAVDREYQIRQSDYVTIDDPTAAFQTQKSRRTTLSRMRDWIIPKAEIEGGEYVQNRIRDGLFTKMLPLDRVSYQTRIADWRTRALSYAAEVCRTQAVIEIIEKKYFDGASILFAGMADEVQHQVKTLQQIITFYNDTVLFRLDRYQGRELLTTEKQEEDDHRPSSLRSGFQIDLDEVYRIIQPNAHEKVQAIVTEAEMESARFIGAHEEALRLGRELLLKGTDQ